MRVILISVLLSLSFGIQAKETRIKIAILDTGVRLSANLVPYLCKTGHAAFTGNNWKTDLNGHGTNIAGLIADSINPELHCLLIFKVFAYRWKTGNLVMIRSVVPHNIAAAINRAIALGAKFINMSISGGNYSIKEDVAIQQALDNKLHVVISAGNSNINLDEECYTHPICNNYKSKYIHIIGSNTHKKGQQPYSNKGKIVTNYIDGTYKGYPKMTGTSQSTGIFTGRLVRATTNKQ